MLRQKRIWECWLIPSDRVCCADRWCWVLEIKSSLSQPRHRSCLRRAPTCLALFVDPTQHHARRDLTHFLRAASRRSALHFIARQCRLERNKSINGRSISSLSSPTFTSSQQAYTTTHTESVHAPQPAAGAFCHHHVSRRALLLHVRPH